MTRLPLLCFLPLLVAADWPAWRGPDRSGVSKETGLLQSWPKGGPKLLWTATGLGGGYATPSVAAGRLYVLGSKAGEEYAHCLDVNGGKPVWSVKIGKVGVIRGPNYPGPRSTPTIDGQRLYALGSDGDLVCLECADGKLVWHHHLEKDFQGNRGTWAYTESPLLDGDVLVCTPGGPVAAMLALDKHTGKVIWKTPIDSANQAGYASPIVATAGGRKLYVQFMGAAAVGIDAKTGERLWRYRKNVGGVNAATPIFHDGCVFTSAAGNEDAGGDALLRLVPTDKGVDVKQVYLLPNMKNFHGGVVRVGEQLYGTGSTGLVCLDFKTGAVKWKHRSVGQGSLMAADGHLYLLNTRGEMALVEATPEGYREKGRLALPKRSDKATFAHPVVANGRLYVRDEGSVFCYDVKGRDAR
jgi:outer membrane protein assembly factor BamB